MSSGDRSGDNVKVVPGTAEARSRVWQEAVKAAESIPRRRPMSREELAAFSRRVLGVAGLGEEHLGYAMVMLNNAFWREQFGAVPFRKRLALLPRCLANLEEVKRRAEELGYKTYVADGSPIVVKIMADEDMDAIFGISCLDSLEKAAVKVSELGVPSLAVPLNMDGCKETAIDTEFVLELMEAAGPETAERTRCYLGLLREARRLFLRDALDRIIGEDGQGNETARIAVDWLLSGGKRYRPFMTLAVFRTFAGACELPASVARAAVAIEAFHKASLVHDDIEDADDMRYGQQTLHRRFGVPVAINVGDWLIGLGYRLLCPASGGSGAETAARIISVMSRAHLALAGGQGEELLWQRQPRVLGLEEVLAWYIRKTSPAFEAALASGLSAAAAYEGLEETIAVFSRNLGAAYQIQNDIEGWQADAVRARPTVLLALALERASPAERDDLLGAPAAERVYEVYERTGVFERSLDLARRFAARAKARAAAMPTPLGEFLGFLAAMITE